VAFPGEEQFLAEDAFDGGIDLPSYAQARFVAAGDQDFQTGKPKFFEGESGQQPDRRGGDSPACAGGANPDAYVTDVVSPVYAGHADAPEKNVVCQVDEGEAEALTIMPIEE
jgi:hypothetical protein